MKIFISVGNPHSDRQDTFIKALEDRVKAEGFEPVLFNRNTFRAVAPLKAITTLINDCSGVIVVAMERIVIETGYERKGSALEQNVSGRFLTTPWNHIEATLAYARNKPLLVLVENGVKKEGLLETGLDWYVQTVDAEPKALTTSQFNGIFSNWKDIVNESASSKVNLNLDEINLENMSLSQLFGFIKVKYWVSLAVFLIGVIGVAFKFGQNFPLIT